MGASPLICSTIVAAGEQHALPNPRTLAAARALIGISQYELAWRAGIHENVVKKFEQGVTVARPSTLLKLRDAFEKEGIFFLEQENGYRMGVLLISK